MKNSITILFIIFCTSCEGKKQTNESVENSPITIEKLSPEVVKIDSIKAKEILEIPTIRYSNLENGYSFNIPFNYRIKYIPSQNSKNSYYKFQWKITDDFEIDSNNEGFKRFSVSNFIPYLSSSSQEGDFLISKSTNKTPLTIADFLKSVDEVYYQDKNSAIFSDYGKLKAFYFEYLPKTKEYLVYLSDTPFQNKQPEAKPEEITNQLLHQIRMAKNVFKPILNQDKNWNSYERQLSILERDFLKKINSEVKKEFSAKQNSKSFSPADQGNNSYYTVFKTNPEIETIWRKLQSVKNSEAITITEADDKIFNYLRDENFRFFYQSDYKVILKTNQSNVFQRKSENSFCLMTQTKDSHFIIMKEFPALEQMNADYYKNEIEFYRVLFENYN